MSQRKNNSLSKTDTLFLDSIKNLFLNIKLMGIYDLLDTRMKSDHILNLRVERKTVLVLSKLQSWVTLTNS